MFLNLLNQTEKELFLELAYLIAGCDQQVSQAEMEVIEAYRREALLDEEAYQFKNSSLESVLAAFKESSNAVKNAVFVESMALVLADDVYHEQEKTIVSSLQKELGIGEAKHQEVVQWLGDMKELYSRANQLIGE